MKQPKGTLYLSSGRESTMTPTLLTMSDTDAGPTPLGTDATVLNHKHAPEVYRNVLYGLWIDQIVSRYTKTIHLKETSSPYIYSWLVTAH